MIGHVAEPLENRVGRAGGQLAVAGSRGAARELDRGERIAIGGTQHAGDDGIGQRLACDTQHEAPTLVVVQWLRIQLSQHAGTVQPRDAASQRRARGRWTCGQEHADRRTRRRELQQHVDVGVVGQVGVVHLQQQVGARR